MQTMRVSDPASTAQVSFLRDLLAKRQCDTEAAQRLTDRIEAGTLTKGLASDSIGWLKMQPYKPTSTPSAGAPVYPVTEPGIYEHDGKIYQVKYNKAKTNLYAKVLTMTVGEAARLTATGSTVKAEYVYAPGAFRMISARDRITGQRAEELSIVFSNCIVCGRHLKAADSVKAGIGPVCRGKV